MTVEYQFNPGGPNEYTLTDSDISASAGHNPVRTHTGKSDCVVTFAFDRNLEPFAQRQDRVNVSIDGDVKFCGYVIDCRHTEGVGQAPTTRLRIDGIEKRLEETRPDDTVTYNQISLADAIRDYWPRTPFSNVTVTDQDTELVADDESIQSADSTTEWENAISIPDTDPIYIESGELRLAQVCWTTEGEDADNANETTIFTLDDYSAGVAEGFDEGTSTTGAFMEWLYTPNHDIAEDNVGVQVRDDSTTTCEVTWTLNGSTMDTVPDGASAALNWSDIGDGFYSGGSGYTGGDLEAGTTYTLRAEVGVIDAGQDYIVDVVAPYDARFESELFFDDDNGGDDGYLDGPELYPESWDAETDTTLVSYNIESGEVVSSWNDTSGAQALAVSNDAGGSYQGESNTDTISETFSDAGRGGRVRFTLSRYGSRTTATPQEGFNNQTIDSYTFTIDGNDLVVIDELELTRSHFHNLQTLHEYGDFLFVVEHGDESLANMPVSSFQRGDETRAKPSGFDDQSNKQPEVQAEAYYNTIYLEGALQDDGTRPTTEVSDSDAVSNDGRDISPGVLRDQNINTDAGAIFRARSLLETALQNRDLKGTVTVSPSLVDPGYARPVDFGDGEENKTVEEVSLRETGDSVEATYEFVVRPGFATEIDDLKRNANEIGNQV